MGEKVPEEEHIAVWKEAAAVAIKAMLQCSFGKRFDKDSAINTMRKSYDVVCIIVCTPSWPVIPVIFGGCIVTYKVSLFRITGFKFIWYS